MTEPSLGQRWVEVSPLYFSGGDDRRRLGFKAAAKGVPPIPNWARVTSALPDFLDELRGAVAADNR